MEESIHSKPGVIFEVSKVLDISRDGNYRVMWAPAWVSKFHLIGCEHLIQDFLQQQQQQQQQQQEKENIAEETIAKGVQLPSSTRFQQQQAEEKETITNKVQPPTSAASTCQADSCTAHGVSEVRRMPQNDHVETLRTGQDGIVLERAYSTNHELVDERMTATCDISADALNNDVKVEVIDDTLEDPIHGSRSESDALADAFIDGSAQSMLYNVELEEDPATFEMFMDEPNTDGTHTHAQTESENENGLVNRLHSLATMVGVSSISSSNIHESEETIYRHRHFDQAITSNSESFLYNKKPSTPRRQYKSYTCSYCEKTFNHKSHYTDHVRTHSGERPFKCNLCDYSCSRNSRLNVHMRTHLREKQFICEVCNKGFAEKSSLRNHVLSHGEELHTCNNCGKIFSSSSTFKFHVSRCCSTSQL